jgi:TonB family protein
MRHGIQGYLTEQSRFRRRLTALIIAASLLYSLPFVLLLLLPGPQQQRVRVFIDRTPVHFGFEGPEQYLERVNLNVRVAGEEGREKPSMVAPVIVPASRRGGRQEANASADAAHFAEVLRELPAGAGNAEDDVMARAESRAGGMPVFRSEQLVILRMVQPEYPEEARRMGLTGKVVFLARVDTLGTITEVELLTGIEGGLLEKAAEVAVRQTRLRPFRSDGVVREVYAVFPYLFTLDD